MIFITGRSLLDSVVMLLLMCLLQCDDHIGHVLVSDSSALHTSGGTCQMLVNSVEVKTGGLVSTSVSLHHLVAHRQMLPTCWKEEEEEEEEGGRRKMLLQGGLSYLLTLVSSSAFL